MQKKLKHSNSQQSCSRILAWSSIYYEIGEGQTLEHSFELMKELHGRQFWKNPL
jgi:hypothetical protein